MRVSSRYKLQFLLYLLNVLTQYSNATTCYQCATNAIVENWSRYGLPMLQGDTLEGDSKCEDERNASLTAPCDGLCVTMNVTREYKGENRVLGVLRDCQKYWKEPQTLDVIRKCNVVSRVLNRMTTVDIEYCFCQGDFCNGRPPSQETLRSGSNTARRTPYRRRSGVSGVFSGFMIFGAVTVVTSLF